MQPKVYIVGGNHSGYGQMFLNAGWGLSDNFLQADLIQFTGGEDVTPALYSEGQHPYTGNSVKRDLFEAGYFAIAQRMGIPMAGICRGGQFLNTMSGGSMHQHVSNHATGRNHSITDLATGREIEVSSTHHQMMRIGASGELLSEAHLNGYKEYVDDDGVVQRAGVGIDVEVVYYDSTKALCFQPHPEFFDAGHECFEYYFELIERCHGLRA